MISFISVCVLVRKSTNCGCKDCTNRYNQHNYNDHHGQFFKESFFAFSVVSKSHVFYLNYNKFISPILPRNRGFFKSSLHKKTRHESDLFVPRGVSFHEQKVLKLVHRTNRYGPSIKPTFEHKKLTPRHIHF